MAAGELKKVKSTLDTWSYEHEINHINQATKCAHKNSTTMPDNGKIQVDGRKFLDRFKSYFGSQISSQPLNEIHIYRLQPKAATKGEGFFIYFCL